MTAGGRPAALHLAFERTGDEVRLLDAILLDIVVPPGASSPDTGAVTNTQQPVQRIELTGVGPRALSETRWNNTAQTTNNGTTCRSVGNLLVEVRGIEPRSKCLVLEGATSVGSGRLSGCRAPEPSGSTTVRH